MAQVSLFTRAAGRVHQRAVDEANDQALLSQIEGTEATRDLWGDTAATTVNAFNGANVATLNVGTGAGLAALNVGTGMGAGDAITIGGAGSATTVQGDLTVAQGLTVNGTVTTVSTTNLVVSDALILLNDGGSGADAGIAIERGGTGDDAVILWEEGAGRFELGLADTSGGTAVPASISSFVDLAIFDLELSGQDVNQAAGAGNLRLNADGDLILNADAGSASSVRLVAANAAGDIRFSTAGTERWLFNNGGDLLALADDTYDIGGTSGSRPATVNAATSVVVATGGTSTVTIRDGVVESTTGALLVQAFDDSALNLTGGDGTGAGTGGTASLNGGAGGPTDGAGGIVNIDGGAGGGTAGVGGAVSILGGNGTTSGAAGGVDIGGGIDNGGGGGAVTIGTNTGTSLVTIGRSDGAVPVTVDAGSAGGTSDLTFGARGQSLTFNDASNTSLTGSISGETSIVGALNTLAGGSAALATTFTNEEGSAITQGQVVYISSANSVSLADAGADAAPANGFYFVVPASIANTASGNFNTAGRTTARFEGSLTLSANDEVFLSASTPGSLTNVAPSGSGEVVQSLGFIRDTLTYDGTTDFLAEIQIVVGAKTVV